MRESGPSRDKAGTPATDLAEVEEAAEAAEAAIGEAEPGRPPVRPAPVAGHGLGARYAGRISRHAVVYGAAAGSSLVAGLASVAIFTRFLDPSEFGKMAVLSTVAAIITLVGTLSVMQGTMRRIFGAAGDEEVGEGVAGDSEAIAADVRLALSTGFALTTLFGAVLFAATLFLGGEIAALAGSPDDGGLIALAGAAGASGALMRFSRNILRLQLRSDAYLAVTLVHSFSGIPVAVVLLERGLGIEAVLIGFIVANAVSSALCIALLTFDLRLAISLREAREILRAGATYVPIALSFQAIQLGDILLVAVFGNFSQSGFYRVAQRIAMPVTYGTSVFQQSWGPLRRDLTYAAVDQVDESRAYAAHLFTYYGVFVTALVLTVAVFADQLVRLASGQFGEAATIVPLTALAVAGHGWFVFAYRNARLPGQMGWMVALSVSAALGFLALAAVLIPPLGAVGAPLAAIAAWGAVTIIMLAANQLAGKPIPFEWDKLLTLAGLTLSVWVISKWVLPESAVGTVAAAALLVGWALALLKAEVVPRRDVHSLIHFARHSTGIDSRRRMCDRIVALDGPDADLIEDLLYRRLSPHELAARSGRSEDEVLADAIRILRAAVADGDRKETDAELGRLLLTDCTRAERDNGLLEIATGGADAIDADLLKRAVAAATSRRVRKARA